MEHCTWDNLQNDNEETKNLIDDVTNMIIEIVSIILPNE